MIGNYANIPLELRELKQWCLWRYVDIGGKKPTKIPYQINGEKCDVTNKTTWSDFNNCIVALSSGTYNGIGFIFSVDDPYTFIDLDDAEGDAVVTERHLKIFHEFDSYSEISPSNKGLHIIIKGNVSKGRRRANIEIYSSDRYATMTGNVYSNRTVINNCQPQLTQLWEQMGGDNVVNISDFKGSNESETDEIIIKRASEATNGSLFSSLFAGEWSSLYPSQSEADFAFIDIVSFYTQNKDQVARIFRASQLGKRQKAKRSDYVGGMIQRSFDRIPPPIDFEGFKTALDLKLEENIKLADSSKGRTTDFDSVNTGSNPVSAANLELPPGLLGEITQFIYNAAPRPVKEVALAAAIGLMAGITGRAYNISGTGLNQYVLLLAMTGAGKEAAASGINIIIQEVKKQVPTSTTYLGPSEISSGPALFKYLGNTSQCFITLLGEFGLRLQQMSSANANGSEVSLRRMLLDLYNKSGFTQVLHPSVYSDKANNTSTVQSPSFSILGESTPERFYGTLNEDMISEGLLPRFLLIEYKGNRPSLNEYHTSATPHPSMIERLSSLVAQCETVNYSNPRRVINVTSDEEATKMLRDFDKYSDEKINSSNKDVIRQLWNRAHMKVLKLSALLAVGENMIVPTISAIHMKWAANLVQTDIAALTERFEAGEIGKNTTENKQVNEVIRVIKDYYTRDWEYNVKYTKELAMYNAKIIPFGYISKRLSAISAFMNHKLGAPTSLHNAIKVLIDTDRLEEVPIADLKRFKVVRMKCYVIKDLSLLD